MSGLKEASPHFVVMRAPCEAVPRHSARLRRKEILIVSSMMPRDPVCIRCSRLRAFARQRDGQKRYRRALEQRQGRKVRSIDSSATCTVAQTSSCYAGGLLPLEAPEHEKWRRSWFDGCQQPREPLGSWHIACCRSLRQLTLRHTEMGAKAFADVGKRMDPRLKFVPRAEGGDNTSSR